MMYYVYTLIEEGGYATTEKDRERFHAPKKDCELLYGVLYLEQNGEIAFAYMQ